MENILENNVKIEIDEGDFTTVPINYDLAVQVESQDVKPCWEKNDELTNPKITEFIEEISYECGLCQKCFLERSPERDQWKMLKEAFAKRRNELRDILDQLHLHIEQNHPGIEISDRDSKVILKNIANNAIGTDFSDVNQNLVKKELIVHESEKGDYEYEISVQNLNMNKLSDSKLLSEPKMYKCKICKKLLKEKSIYEHKRFVHGNLQFECDLCGVKVKSKYTLVKHMKNVHKFLKKASVKTEMQEKLYCLKFPCKQCPKEFKKREYLRLHVRSCHGDPIECTVCKTMLKSKAYLSSHMKRTHSDSGKVKCEYCHKNFKNTHYLRRHTNSAHKSFDCKVCREKFENKYRYDKHLGDCKRD